MSKKSPQLRFEGFMDDWEERKLGDVGDTFTGLTGKTKEDFGHGSARFVTYVNVFQNPIATLDQLDAVEIDEKQNQVQKGDVFFTTSSETPEEVGMSSVWTYDTKNVYLNSFTFGYRPRVSFDLNYMASMLRSPSIRKKITFLAQGISRYNISKTKMLEIEIPAPNLSEQTKIGLFFKGLDDTIALHQRKLDLLKEQKKGYLQKMFPKNGAKVPELRFAGFADDWEERKLEDISEIIDGDRGKNYPSGDDFKNNGHTLFLSAANVTKQGFVFKETQYITKLKSESLGSGKVILNDIILTSRGSIGHIGFYDKKTHEYIPQARINSGMLILRTDKLNSPSFIAQFLKSPWGIKQIKLISFGSAQPQLTKKDIKNFKIILPKMEEQQKIGSFFKQLDETIALHQRKLDLLKEQKKGFLQKMFV
ncbi:restriction endonuclease subunit S [Lactococcus lactis]|uniref:restriction endonuclease subunit S n=1 Tax=Lactococcus lactis TaxID=1358 RepID=UPI003D0E754B